MQRKKSLQLTATILCTAIFVAPLNAAAATAAESTYSRIAHYYLPVFGDQVTQETNIEHEKLKTTDKPNMEVTKLCAGEQRRIICALLSQRGNTSLQELSPIFDESSWKDLELFCASDKDRAASVSQSWNKTITSIGDIASKRILIQPTTDVETLKKRQTIISQLRDDKNKRMRKKLTRALQSVKKQEAKFWGLWDASNAINELFEKQWYPFGKLDLTKNKYLLGLNSRYLDFSLILGAIGSAGALLGAGASAFAPQILENILNNENLNLNNIDRRNIDFLLRNKLVLYTYAGLLAVGAGAGLYGIIKLFNMKKDHINHMQEKLVPPAKIVNALGSIYQSIKSNKTIRNNIPSLKAIPQLAIKSSKLSYLLKLLQTNTFKGSSSYFSHSGRILSAFQLIKEVKNDFTQALEAIGELDAYLSMATLLDEHEEQEARFCFVDFVEQSERPQLSLDGFWFPQVLFNDEIKSGEKPVILNSIEMGEGTDLSNIILTGPNKGGKSTILKAIITSLLLAQSYGIAPAKSMQLTPFSKIQTYINIPDSTSLGISLFQAELERVARLIDSIRSLEPSQFAFTILDEIFSGTSPEEAVIGSGSIIEPLCYMRNSMNIISTHYHQLTDLERHTNGIFKNYKVVANLASDGSILSYLYQWQPGISNQHVALALIKESGLLSQSTELGLAQKLANSMQSGGIQ